MPSYPINSQSMVLERESVNFFQSVLPQNWLCEKPVNDFGIDQRVEIVNPNGEVSGLEFLVQLKASVNGLIVEENILINGFKTQTYNYLRNKLQAVIIFKYISSTKKGYWVFLRDIPKPNNLRKTFTIKIPVGNDISMINWHSFTNIIETVQDKKISANRVD